MTEPDAELEALVKAVFMAALEVHRILGPGFLESLYEEALAIEFRLCGIPFERQKSLTVKYKGENIGEGRLDFLVGGRLIVELKAVSALAPVHMAQVISYLKSTGLQLGVLINFNSVLLKEGFKRVIYSEGAKR
jgi:GxxExxY protein